MTRICTLCLFSLSLGFFIQARSQAQARQKPQAKIPVVSYRLTVLSDVSLPLFPYLIGQIDQRLPLVANGYREFWVQDGSIELGIHSCPCFRRIDEFLRLTNERFIPKKKDLNESTGFYRSLLMYGDTFSLNYDKEVEPYWFKTEGLRVHHSSREQIAWFYRFSPDESLRLEIWYAPYGYAKVPSVYTLRTTAPLNLRLWPTSSSFIIEVLEKGQELCGLQENYYSEDGQYWHQVRTASGYEGFVCPDYVERIAPHN